MMDELIITQENIFLGQPTLQDALLILYPKITKYELELLVLFIRNPGWLRVKKINHLTNIPRTKIYKVINDMIVQGFIEEKKLVPTLPELGGRKARARAMLNQGFNPQGEARGYKVFQLMPESILDRISWTLSSISELQTSLLKETE